MSSKQWETGTTVRTSSVNQGKASLLDVQGRRERRGPMNTWMYQVEGESILVGPRGSCNGTGVVE